MNKTNYSSYFRKNRSSSKVIQFCKVIIDKKMGLVFRIEFNVFNFVWPSFGSPSFMNCPGNDTKVDKLSTIEKLWNPVSQCWRRGGTRIFLNSAFTISRLDLVILCFAPIVIYYKLYILLHCPSSN